MINIRYKIESTKHQIPNKFKAQMTKIQNRNKSLEHLDFGFNKLLVILVFNFTF